MRRGTGYDLTKVKGITYHGKECDQERYTTGETAPPHEEGLRIRRKSLSPICSEGASWGTKEETRIRKNIRNRKT